MDWNFLPKDGNYDRNGRQTQCKEHRKESLYLLSINPSSWLLASIDIPPYITNLELSITPFSLSKTRPFS